MRLIHAIVALLLMAASASAQVTSDTRYLVGKQTLTSGEFLLTGTNATVIYTAVLPSGEVRKVTFSDAFDLGGLGPTDSVTFGGVTTGTLNVTGTSWLSSLTVTGNAVILGSITGSSLSLTGGIIADSLTLTNGLTSSTASVTTGTIGTATSTTQVVLGSLFLVSKVGPSIFSSGSNITLSAAFGNVSITGSNAAGGHLLSNRVTASNWLRATGTATIDGASTFGGLMIVNNDVTSTGTITGVTLTGGTINGSAGSFSTLSGATITPTTLNVLGNSTFTGTSALLGLVGVAGQPTTTAAMFINSRSVSGTNGYGLFVNATTGATNNYAMSLTGGALLVGTLQSSQTTGIVTTGAYNTTLDYRQSSQTILGQSSNIVQLGNHSGWVGSSMFAGSTEMLRATVTGLVTGTTTGNASARLQVDSTTQGFLMPRMTTTQRDAIAAPATGLMLWNTTTGTVNFYNGSAWVP